MKKRIGIFISLACTLLLGTIGFSSCDSKVQHQKPYLQVDKEEVTLLIGETEKLSLNYAYGEETPTFVSSNEGVATVDKDGVVCAVSVGSATIEVAYGGVKDTCEVSVGTYGQLPAVMPAQIASQEVSVVKGDRLNFESVVLFNGKEYTDGTYTFTSSDESVGTIDENGVFTAVNRGETMVTVSAKWRGVESVALTQTYTVSVEKLVQLYVNDGSSDLFTLYTLEQFGGEKYATEMPFTAYAIEDGVEKTPTVTVENNSVVSYDAGTKTLTAEKYGVSDITLSMVDEDGVTQERTVRVEVLRPVATYAQKLEKLSAVDGDGYPIESVFLQDAVTEAWQLTETKKQPLTLSGGLVLGLQTAKDSITETKVVLYTETYGYEFEVSAYTKILKTAEDIKALTITKELIQSGKTKIEGYYLLANSIDATAQTAEHHAGLNETNIAANGAYYVKGGAGFSGTFDGNGYTLKVNVDSYGLFGYLLDATVKNLVLEAHVSAASNHTRSCSVLAHKAGDAANFTNIENLYVKAIDERPSNKSNVNVSLIYQGGTTHSLKNIALEFTNCTYITDKSQGTVKAGGLVYLQDTVSQSTTFTNNTVNVYVITTGTPALTILANKTTFYYANTAKRFKNFAYVKTLSEATNLSWTYDETQERLVLK